MLGSFLLFSFLPKMVEVGTCLFPLLSSLNQNYRSKQLGQRRTNTIKGV